MSNKFSVLIVDDDELLNKELCKSFTKKGFIPTSAYSAEEAKEIVTSKKFDYAVIDLKMSPGENGLEVVKFIKDNQPNTKSLIFTGFGTISTAVEATKRGAVNYLTKPASINQIISALTDNEEITHQIPSLEEVTNQYVNRILEEFDGNISKSAKALGLHRRSLQRKLKS